MVIRLLPGLRKELFLLVLAWIASTCAAQTESEEATYENPILPGFHADPSICRVGDDYYLVNSSFEFFPGVPIFQSRDLVHWRQIGYCLTRKSQLRLNKVRASGGIYAPTLRWHDGVFYMVTTNVDGGGNFYVTATDPAGPWSEPVWLDKSGIDPSLLFDDDDAVYYTRHQGMGDGGIAQCTLDLKTGKLVGELREIWKGAGGVWPEGPHLYKISGHYYLMIAEGGTSYDHRITVAKSDSPWGPFVGDPANPILTHADRPESPLQALGHGDLIETPDGWWMVCLGIRPQGGRFHHLGRETMLAPVTWNDDGWPAVNGGRGLELTMPAPKLPPHPWEEPAARDEFDDATLGPSWVYLRNPHEENYSLTERPGYLRLKGTAVSLNDQDSPTWVGRAQTALKCRIAAALDFDPQQDHDEAGLTIRGNEKFHAEIGVTRREGRRQAFFRRVYRGWVAGPDAYADLPRGPVVLTVDAKPLSYEFSYQSGDDPPQTLGRARTRDFSSETVGGFTGVYFALYATGNGQPAAAPADLDWFECDVDPR